MTVRPWPAGPSMSTNCPKCKTADTVSIDLARESDMDWRPVDCGHCYAGYALNSDGTTQMLAPTRTTRPPRAPVTHFDPNGWKSAPSTTNVEHLLGGVARAMFPDGTEQFIDFGGESYEDLIYSPRLRPEELEQFCAENMLFYEEFNSRNEAALIDGARVPMKAFWLV